MPKRPSVPPRWAWRSTTTRPRSSQAGKSPCWAAQTSGPSPPGPPPMMIEDSITRDPLSGQDVVEHARHALDDLLVDRPRGRQIDAGRRELETVGAGARVLAVGRQCRQWMEEGSRLDLRSMGRTHDRQALVGRHLHAGQPHHRFVLFAQRRWEAYAGDALERLAIEFGDAGVAPQDLADAPQLRLSDRGLQVGDAIIVADPLVPIGTIGRHAMVAQLA